MLLFITPVQAQEDGALQRLQRTEASVGKELLLVERDIQSDRERLQKAELGLRASTITPALLEDARLELVSFQSRENGLQTRLKARRSALALLGRETGDIEARLQRSNVEETELRKWREDLLDLQQRRAVLESLIDKIERLHQRYESRTALARQRLNLLQARFELPDLEASRQIPGQAGSVLQKQVDELLTRASGARQDASLLNQDDPHDRAQRRLLELQAMLAEERAEFLQMNIERLQVERVLKSLTAFSGARSIPVRVLKTVLNNVDGLQQELKRQQDVLLQKRAQFKEQRQIVSQQGAIATGDDSTLAMRLSLIDEIKSITEEQQQAIDKLDKQLKEVSQSYQAALTTNQGAELTAQRELPADAESWKQLVRNLASLPLRVAIAFKEAVLNFADTFRASSPATRISCLVLLLALLFVGWQGRRVLTRLSLSENDSAEDTSASISWMIVQRNLVSLLAPLFVLGAGLILEIRQVDLLLLMTPLLIWPVVRFSLDFINDLMDEYTPELGPVRTRVLLLETRWVVIFAAVLAAVLVIAHSVALSPIVIDAIERLSMLCLLLIALPLIHLRKLLLEGVRGDVKSRLLRGITLAIPLMLALCAIVGLTGYVNLAWAIAIRIGWLLLVILGIQLVRNVLRGLLKATIKKFQQSNAESAPYWEQYILGPGYRLTLLLVILAAAQLLFYLYNWNAQTPVVRVVPLMLDTTLFSIGETAIKLKTLALALLAVFVAIWGAGWSKQVSYRWVYTGVQDQGIRNSLSTFTQYLVVLLGLVVAMKIIGLDLTALTVFAGAFGVGIGFGMQQIVVNFISGILLLVERPLATTDIVKVDQFEGEVTRIGIRSLTVKTFDSQEVIIPNSSVITKPFTNWTRTDDVMRTVLMVGISYEDDPHQAAAMVLEIVKTHPAVLESPGSKVLLWEYGDSALMLRVQFHSRIRGEIGRADVRSQILFSIWDAFKEAGITIPYPQRDIHMHAVD